MLGLGCTAETSDGAGGGAGAGTGAGGSEGPPAPGTYQDNFVQVARGPGSTFVEILEVRTAPNAQVLYCSAVQGLVALDATDPANPVLRYRVGSSLGSMQYPRCQHLAFTDSAVYISNRGDEIQPTPFVTAFDTSTTPPKEGPSYTEAGLSVEGLAAEGNFLYAAVHKDGLRVLENTGAALTLRGSVTSLNNAWAVEANAGLLYVADGDGGVAIVDAQNPAAPVEVGRTTIEGTAQQIALDVSTMHAYVSAGAAGMIVVDVSDPTSPVQVGRADTPGTTTQISLADGRAFVADWNDVRVYDIADPTQPQLIAVEAIPVESFPRILGVGAAGNLAFAGEWTGLYVYDLSPEFSVPQIRVEAAELDVGNVLAGDTRVVATIVENEGPEPLVVSKVEGVGLAVAAAPFELSAGEKIAIEVTLAGSDLPMSGTLHLWSDDPDEPETVVTVVANSPTLGVGDVAPDVVLQLTTGGTWSLSEERGSVVLLSYFATF